MKIVKKIFYTIFGLLMATTLALIGVILYAEFTGHRFSMDKHTSLGDSSDEESRLAYDENGNLAELPGSADVPSEQAAAGQIPPDSSANISSADPSAVPLTARRLLLPNRQILMLARRAWTYLPAILRQPPIPLIPPRLPMHQREKKPLQAEGAIQVELPLLTRRTKPNVPILWIPAPAFSTLTPAPMPPLSP